MTARTHSFTRKRDVLADGGKPKVCPKCELWFSQQPRERICAGCRPRSRQTLRITRRQQVNAVNPQVEGTYSDVLALTFKPGVPLWKILALEAAAEQVWSYKRPKVKG